MPIAVKALPDGLERRLFPILGDRVAEPHELHRSAMNLGQLFLMPVTPPFQIGPPDRHGGKHGGQGDRRQQHGKSGEQ